MTDTLDRPLIAEYHAAPGIAYSHAVPQPGLARNHYKSDSQRYLAAWHAAHCQIPDCEWCQALCDDGLVIACDSCGHVQHTDWLGWCGTVDERGGCTVFCPECAGPANDEPRRENNYINNPPS